MPHILPDDSNKINKAIPINVNGKCHIAALVMAKSDKDDEMMSIKMSIKMSNRIKAKNLT